MEPQNQPAAHGRRDMGDNRRQPRFKLEVDIGISSRTCGVLKGHTVDISASGISAILRIEVPVKEKVELEFILPLGPEGFLPWSAKGMPFATASSSCNQTLRKKSFKRPAASLPLNKRC